MAILKNKCFMSQPPRFVNKQFPSHVCKLNKAVYGLKQALQAWFTKLSNALLNWGFQLTRVNDSMFLHHSTNEVLILLIYVDDILVTDNNSFYVFSFISYLNSLFAIRDLGHLNYFLGVEVLHGGTTLHLNQNKSIQDLLTPNNTLDSKPKHTSSMLGKTLSQNDGEQLMDARLYCSIITNPYTSLDVNT